MENTENLIIEAQAAASNHILKKGSSELVLKNEDIISCFIESASSRHGSASWGRTSFYYTDAKTSKTRKIAKAKVIALIN